MELEFCDDKIRKNFSNYSSWHYKSLLLPILHPHESDSTRPISEAKLKEELQQVIEAEFTDPNDSSAWFYQRWLLGYSDPKLDLAAVKITKSMAIISFTRSVDLIKDGIAITVENIPELNSGKWKSITGGNSDAIWMQEGDFQLSDPPTVAVTFEGNRFELATKNIPEEAFVGIKCPSFGYEFGAAVIDELKSQLESCNQLLEFESNSKWALLTASLLMRSIDRFHYHTKSIEFLEKLQKVDVLRAGYYKDLASKWTVEIKLKNWIESGDYEKLDLSGLDLTTIHYHQYFAIATKINLKGNPKLNLASNLNKFGRRSEILE